MARTTRRYTIRASYRRSGSYRDPDTKAAIRRASKQNMLHAQRAAVALARERKSPPRRGGGGRRKGPSLLQTYRGSLVADGMGFQVGSSHPAARLFEVGARPHVIEAKPGQGRGARGRFIKGAARLAWFDGGWKFAKRVQHPGFAGRYPIRDAFRDEAPEFERNYDREIAREF